MQNDILKRFSKDLQGVLSMPGNFLSKQAKKIPLPGDKKKSAGSQVQESRVIKSASDSCSLHEYSEVIKASVDSKSHPLNTAPTKQGRGSSVKSKRKGGGGESIESPISPASQVFPKEESPIIHYPHSVSSAVQFSPQRRAWVQSNVNQSLTPQLSSVLKSVQAWDMIDYDHHYGQTHPHPNQCAVRSAYNNPDESTGLLLVKIMQVTNKTTTKIFDVEWSLRVGSVERTSYPSRSFKDNSGNTATMNEVFLFDVNEPFQLEMTVTGNPVPTKFGTMAGLTNGQTINLGQLNMSFCLEPMGKSVRTYKLGQPASEDSGNCSVKSDCEVVVMIGLHILEEPIEDRSWETEALYQGFLTLMTRGGRMGSWKRYWVILEGRAIKLYDAEYQLARDVMAIIPLAHIVQVQPPDYEKVDVGANGFSMTVDPHGFNMRSIVNYGVEVSELDYCIYAFTDSSHLHEMWNAHLEEALDRYQRNMARRQEVERARLARRTSQSPSRHSFGSSVPPTPQQEEEEEEEDGAECLSQQLIDPKYVW